MFKIYKNELAMQTEPTRKKSFLRKTTNKLKQKPHFEHLDFLLMLILTPLIWYVTSKLIWYVTVALICNVLHVTLYTLYHQSCRHINGFLSGKFVVWGFEASCWLFKVSLLRGSLSTEVCLLIVDIFRGIKSTMTASWEVSVFFLEYFCLQDF